MAFGTLQQYLSQVHAMPKQAVVYARSVTVLVLLHLQVYRSIEEKDGEYLAVSSHWCTYVHWVRLITRGTHHCNVPEAIL